MRYDIAAVALISFLVEMLILSCANRLCGDTANLWRILAAALVSAIYCSVYLLKEYIKIGSPICRAGCLLLVVVTAFGFRRATIRSGIVYVLLRTLLRGIMLWIGGAKETQPLLVAVCSLLALYVIVFCSRSGGSILVPVELVYGGNHLHLTALRDTGNTLRDPVTGKPVLVVGADAAQQLTGLSTDQLRRPVETMGSLPGLRLIPYRSVGTENGFLLALRISSVRIGSWKGSSIVAFSPVVLSTEGTYQALTGGI